MCKMVEIEFIRKKHLVDGWSVRKISRQLGVARQTASTSKRGSFNETARLAPFPRSGSTRAFPRFWLAGAPSGYFGLASSSVLFSGLIIIILSLAMSVTL